MAHNSQIALNSKKSEKIIEASTSTIIHNMEKEISEILTEIVSKPQKAKLNSLQGKLDYL